MTTSRTLTAALIAALLVALAVTSVAVAARPGRWIDNKRKLDFGIAQDRKHFEYLDWTCKGATLASPFKEGQPKIHRHGKFKFTTSALAFKNGGPADKPVKVHVRGRFVKRHGKVRAIGKIRSSYCGPKARRFRAHWTLAQG
jgi:hypothetical protein